MHLATIYRNDSFYSQESDTMILTEYIFCLLGISIFSSFWKGNI